MREREREGEKLEKREKERDRRNYCYIYEYVHTHNYRDLKCVQNGNRKLGIYHVVHIDDEMLTIGCSKKGPLRLIFVGRNLSA